MVWTGRIWLDGSFGFSQGVKKPLEVVSPPSYKLSPTEEEVADCARCFLASGATFEEVAAITKQERERLGLSIVLNSTETPERAARGSLGISSHGRKVVRCAAELMESLHDKRRLVFQTLTLPTITAEEGIQLARDWSKIVHTYCKRLRRDLAARGLPEDFVGVTELQEKRFERTGVVAYHLHLIFVGRHGIRSNSPWTIPLAEHDANWKGTIENYLGREADFSKAANTQPVKKSAAGYLAKYLSKGRSKRAAPDEGDCPRPAVAEHPSAWYFCSRKLKKLVLDTRISHPILVNHVAELALRGSLEVVFLRPVEIISKSGEKYPIGFYGRLTPDALSAVQAYYYREFA